MRRVMWTLALAGLLGGAAGSAGDAAATPAAATATATDGLIVLAATLDEPSGFATRLGEWAGLPGRRTLHVTVANSGDTTLSGVVVRARLDGRAWAPIEIDDLAPGGQVTASATVGLAPLDYGRQVATVDVGPAGSAPVEFTAATSDWPWLLLIGGPLAAGFALARRRERRRGAVAAPWPALALSASATALVLAGGIAATTLVSAHRADAEAVAGQRRLRAELAAESDSASPVSGSPATTGLSGSASAITTGTAAGAAGSATEARVTADPPVLKVPALGEPLGVIRIPAFGDDYEFVSVEGVRDADLAAGPGHYPGTDLPGQDGNFVLTAHRTSHLAPFADLDDLAKGDEVLFDAGGGTFTYRVTGFEIVRPTALEVLLPVPGKRLLTLITCHPEHSTRERYVVTAEFESFTRPG